MPKAKAQNQANSIQKLVKKYDVSKEQDLAKFHKDLQYKFNFLKLAYPNLLNEAADSAENKNKYLDLADIQ